VLCIAKSFSKHYEIPVISFAFCTDQLLDSWTHFVYNKQVSLLIVFQTTSSVVILCQVYAINTFSQLCLYANAYTCVFIRSW
jgi:hypothetical protein